MEKIVLITYDFPDGSEHYTFHYTSKQDAINDLKKLVEHELIQHNINYKMAVDWSSKRPKAQIGLKKKTLAEMQEKFKIWESQKPANWGLYKSFKFLNHEFSINDFIKLNKEKSEYNLNLPEIITLDEWFWERLVKND